ncbi:MAG: hypothetical protein KMY53_00385 [Desulfarculus sp.]|nr:hypothetical protein [Pseudomonadota bacterium]MBV1736592.1 hypothetical protein [Desulfarculus sp.]
MSTHLLSHGFVKTSEFRVQIAFVGNHPDQVLSGSLLLRAVDAADVNSSGIRASQAG